MFAITKAKFPDAFFLEMQLDASKLISAANPATVSVWGLPRICFSPVFTPYQHFVQRQYLVSEWDTEHCAREDGEHIPVHFFLSRLCRHPSLECHSLVPNNRHLVVACSAAL
jgi:hypothetical protein